MDNLKDIEQMGQSFSSAPLNEDDLSNSPFDLFTEWFTQQQKTSCEAPNAMSLSNIGLDGYPNTRIVLLKQFSEDGFVFFTNYKSEKGVSIAMDSKVAMLFYWPETQRQVRILGNALKTDEKTSENYFLSRPYESQISAIASPQSTAINGRAELIDRVEQAKRNYPEGETKRPSNWGGYLVTPKLFEFWQGGDHRMHDRIIYKLARKKWHMKRLAP